VIKTKGLGLLKNVASCNKMGVFFRMRILSEYRTLIAKMVQDEEESINEKIQFQPHLLLYMPRFSTNLVLRWACPNGCTRNASKPH
jgi:hypothetical protein